MTNEEDNQDLQKSGDLFIISAPSGTGKTTLVQSLAGSSHSLLVSVSYTTRPRRPDEGDGVAYHFIDETTFREMVEKDQFLEHAKVFDHYYGTSREWIKQHLDKGIDIILEIDWQGAQQVRSVMPGVVSIFILPPSYHSLEERLYQRDDEDNATIRRRMKDAKWELSHYCEFDYIVINDEFDSALADLIAILRAAKLGGCSQSRYYDNFVNQLLEERGQIQ